MRRVLITGGASGIGAATGERLRKDGWEVALVDRHTRDDPAIRPLDVRDEARWAVLVEELWPLHALVNCAGVRTQAPLIDLEVEEFERLMAIHVRGSFLGLREVARRWVRDGTGGAVVNIASVAATHAVPGQIHYVTSKAGVLGLTRAAAAELAPHRIRVNAIAPGAILTPMTADRQDDPDKRAWVEQRAPAGRFGEPHEVAAGISWLLSDDATFVDGAILPIDGGWTAT